MGAIAAIHDRPPPIESFNPRPRVGAISTICLPTTPAKFQSAPPRGGDWISRASRPFAPPVSIRAPAWGRCAARQWGHRNPHVSIRAPAWGRFLFQHRPIGDSWFQSAPPRGGDQRTPAAFASATRFQSAPPRGGDRPSARYNESVSLFQSAPPRGGDALRLLLPQFR